MPTTTQKETAMNTQPHTCDICHQPILAGEKVHDDGDEIAHTACIRNWFRVNFSREQGLA